MKHWWNDDWQEKTEVLRKTHQTATLSATIPQRHLGSEARPPR